MMTLFKAINAARDKALIKNPITEWAIGQNAGVESMHRELLAALPDKPKTEDELYRIVLDSHLKKGCKIDVKSLIAFTVGELKAANVLYVEDKE